MTPILAAADVLTISINLLLVIHVIVCLLLALVVLMQRPKQEGLGAAFGSGLTDQAFGARTTDVLQKGTVYLGTIFFIITLLLAILIGKRQNRTPAVVNNDKEKTEESAKPADVPEGLKGEAPAVAPDPAEVPEAPAAKPEPKPVPPAKVPDAPVAPAPPANGGQ